MARSQIELQGEADRALAELNEAISAGLAECETVQEQEDFLRELTRRMPEFIMLGIGDAIVENFGPRGD